MGTMSYIAVDISDLALDKIGTYSSVYVDSNTVFAYKSVLTSLTESVGDINTVSGIATVNITAQYPPENIPESLVFGFKSGRSPPLGPSKGYEIVYKRVALWLT